MPRLFMAVRIPSTGPLRRVIGRLQGMPDVKPVEPENLHFTLRFLGDVSDTTRDGLVGLLRNAHSERTRFPLTLQGTDAFPRPDRPSVVWVGCDPEGAQGLRDLAVQVDRLCDDMGLGPRDKPFVPHLTLARVRSKEGRGVKEAAKVTREERATAYGEVQVERWHLIHSILTDRGPTYHDIAEVTLR